ncbi:MAG: hypothetical protein ABH849_02440 [Nanoarchaeota archaeon]
MKPIELAKKLEGIQTVKTTQKELKIKRSTAIKYLSILKKAGYLTKKGGGKQPRIYTIRRTKIDKVGNPGIYDIINQNSPINIVTKYEHRVFGKKLTIEETIIKAIETKEFRTILAMLALFNKVKDWKELKEFAQKRNIARKVGALYDVAKQTIKVRKMDLRTRKALLNSKIKDKYIVYPMKSKDFTEIEKLWKVYIPFGKADLRRYKEW